MKVNFVQHGDFTKFEKFLTKVLHFRKIEDSILKKYGERGVAALKEATPKRTGKTADSWRYEIVHSNSGDSVVWHNDNVIDGKVIALLIQYGHGTPQGTYVQGRDYINPAIASIFDDMANDAWKEVTS